MRQDAVVYLKYVRDIAKVEGCLVHGFHVHPRRLDADGLPIEEIEVEHAIDQWLQKRQIDGKGSNAEVEAFAEIERYCNKSVQFKLLLSKLAHENYRSIQASERIGAIVVKCQKGESLAEAAARDIEARYSREQVQAASVTMIEDASPFVLRRISGYVAHGFRLRPCQLDGDYHHSEDALIAAIDRWLDSRNDGQQANELKTFIHIETMCQKYVQFKIGLSALRERNYRNIKASSRIASLSLSRNDNESLASAAGREIEVRLSAEEVKHRVLSSSAAVLTRNDEVGNVDSEPPLPGVVEFCTETYGDSMTGEYIYIIKDGQLYAAEKGDHGGGMQHTSFFGVETPVQSSGWIRMVAGQITAYRRWSGHFHPGVGSERVFKDWCAHHSLALRDRNASTGFYDWIDVVPRKAVYSSDCVCQ